MASSEHIRLSDYIKSVHSNLRKRSLEVGPEEAWKRHCTEQDILSKYASAMKELATQHWEESCKQGSKAISRIKWVHSMCRWYFHQKEYIRQRNREIDIAKKIDIEISDSLPEFSENSLKLLDVGSCYNPFKDFSLFDVLAIDIAPANENVLQCDFLNAELSDSLVKSDSNIISLKREDFDVVVFSLLLEYLPSPEQRLACCSKALQLLKTEGILIIITPDSKHVGANAKIMKSWRFLLSKLGFSRIKYEKLPYMHCMIFRKSLRIEIAERWSQIYANKDFHETMVIPQDLNQGTSKICEESLNEDVNK